MIFDLECATCLCKGLFKCYDFAYESFSIGVFMYELWAQKVVGFISWHNQEFPKLHLVNPTIFLHFYLNPTTNHKVYYIGESGDSFKVHAMMCIYECGLIVIHPCINLVPICINCSFFWFQPGVFTPFFMGARKHTPCLHSLTKLRIDSFLPLLQLVINTWNLNAIITFVK